jgi:hypothetical protein
MATTDELPEWITTDKAIEVGAEHGFHYNVEYLRRLLRKKTVEGELWGRSWRVRTSSWLDHLRAAKELVDKRRGGKSSK